MAETTDLKAIQSELSDNVLTETPESLAEDIEQQSNGIQIGDKYGFGNIINEIFKSIAKKRGMAEEDIEMDEHEIKIVNAVISQIMKKLTAKYGLEENTIMLIVAGIGILVPRIIKIMSKGDKKNDDEKERNNN